MTGALGEGAVDSEAAPWRPTADGPAALSPSALGGAAELQAQVAGQQPTAPPSAPVCPSCLTAADDSWVFCPGCGRQLPLRSWATARATHAGGEAPQTLPPPPDPDAQHPSTGRTTP